MNNKYEYLLEDISKLKNVGKKTSLLLKKKNINNIFDILWRLPQSYTDRSNISKIKDIHIIHYQEIPLIPEFIKYTLVGALVIKLLFILT